MNAPDSPPQVIHMPLEELLDSDLCYDDPDSAGENPTAYVLKSDMDKMAEELRKIVDLNPVDDAFAMQVYASDALAIYGEEKG